MTDALKVTLNNVVLPAEIIELTRNDELLWSEGTGRSATTGAMAGSVVAKKQTYTIKWGVITRTQYTTIRDAADGGFIPLKIEINGSVFVNITVYRGAIPGTFLGTFGNTSYFKDVSLELVQK